MTLLELLAAMSIMVLVVGAIGVLAKGIQDSFHYTEGHSAATQHARVTLERISRTVSEATANEQFPGAIVVVSRSGSYRFPDALVVWHPDGDPADPDGLPRFNELVVYCPQWDMPNRLLELTLPGDTRTVPAAADQAAWAAAIEAAGKSNSSNTVVLTDLVRTSSITDVSPSSLRAAVRFETRLRPSQSEWSDYAAGTLGWDELAWVQGIYGSQTGLRQLWVRIELQLMPGEESIAANPTGEQAVPFLGSAALYYGLHR